MQNSLRISSGAISDRGLSEKRPQNEDSFLEMSHCGIYAVADGVGGAQAGEVASQMAVEILGEAFANRKENQDAEAVMRAAISQANSAIHQMAQELPQLASMATTIVALHLTENVATIGHVGDSRLYRVDRDGNIFAETEDHSMVADEVRAGRMTAEQAENHPSRNIINRALGADSSVNVDLKTIMIDPGTSFLLCSDGITRHVNDQEIKGVLTFGGDPADICDYLKKLCYERGAEDNLTALVVKVGADVSAPAYAFPSAEPIDEEPTVASARTVFEEPELPSDEDDDDELLELETLDLSDLDDTLEFQENEIDPATVENIEVAEPVAAPVPSPIEPQAPAPKEEFSMFGNSLGETDQFESQTSGSTGKVLTALSMLIIGSLIGLGVYHFVLVPKPAAVPDEKLSVMKTEDIAFSSFEKLRRTVDADPAAYVKEVPPADDAEDYYLIGRAYLLTADFPKARLALIEAQKQISKAEPANAKVLRSDIAVALAITNDPTLQVRFKQDLDSQKGFSNSANTNSNK